MSCLTLTVLLLTLDTTCNDVLTLAPVVVLLTFLLLVSESDKKLLLGFVQLDGIASHTWFIFVACYCHYLFAPAWSSTVQVVARKQWFVYRADSLAAFEMSLIILESWCSPTGALQYHGPDAGTAILGLWQNASQAELSLLT